ncbi:MAG: hypothetical protein ACTH54_03235 [Vagococcus salmoninarum]|uniref:hypothetical protein n=1 Tax=Vagococcus salmoninarum TaxID=2739 RepID=UPI003F996AC9
MAKPKFSVTKESDSGRNEKFHHNYTGKDLTRNQLVKEIESGKHSDMHVRTIGGIKTPVTNPDKNKGNNLD